MIPSLAETDTCSDGVEFKHDFYKQTDLSYGTILYTDMVISRGSSLPVIVYSNPFELEDRHEYLLF
jgi:hypothetical protein